MRLKLEIQVELGSLQPCLENHSREKNVRLEDIIYDTFLIGIFPELSHRFKIYT
jgi:hypothetical protein